MLLLTPAPGWALAKIYSLKKGALIPDGVVAIARRERMRTGLVSAIGGFSKVRIGYFDQGRKKYEEHDIEEELEVTSLLGNITTKDGKPFLHVHGTFGRRDLSVIGGHIMTATVSPLLEVVITPTTNRARRVFDESVGLNVIG
jgi:uncharacterized protein